VDLTEALGAEIDGQVQSLGCQPVADAAAEYPARGRAYRELTDARLAEK